MKDDIHPTFSPADRVWNLTGSPVKLSITARQQDGFFAVAKHSDFPNGITPSCDLPMHEKGPVYRILVEDIRDTPIMATVRFKGAIGSGVNTIPPPVKDRLYLVSLEVWGLLRAQGCKRTDVFGALIDPKLRETSGPYVGYEYVVSLVAL